LERNSQPWEEAARGQAKELGFSVSKDKNGKVELRKSPRKAGNSIVLPFLWEKKSWGDCYTRIRNIYVYTTKGFLLVEAADLAARKAPAISRDWTSAANQFKKYKTNAENAIKISTWDHDYQPVISMAIEILQSKKPPINAKALILHCVSDWRTGSRMRQIRVRSLSQFLTFCVEDLHLPDVWEPPKSQKVLIGVTKPGETISQKAHPFARDEDILNLIDSLPTQEGESSDREAAVKWKNATMLMAELGLRPIELNFLKVKTNEISGDLYWWCDYCKKGGNGATEAREIHPLPLIEADGSICNWNLIARFRANDLPLPSLDSGNGAGECWKVYFNRKPFWKSLKKRMLEQEDRRLTSYSFRHSYSVRGTRHGIDSGSMALSMGHNLQTHLLSYPWAEKSSTAEAFATAYKKIKSTQTSARRT